MTFQFVRSRVNTAESCCMKKKKQSSSCIFKMCSSPFTSFFITNIFNHARRRDDPSSGDSPETIHFQLNPYNTFFSTPSKCLRYLKVFSTVLAMCKISQDTGVGYLQSFHERKAYLRFAYFSDRNVFSPSFLQHNQNAVR